MLVDLLLRVDYLLPQVYAPWCHACKSFEPKYQKLGEALKDIPSIVVAKIDATKNELENLKVRFLSMGCLLAIFPVCCVGLSVQQ